jgi:hypothetical protein
VTWPSGRARRRRRRRCSAVSRRSSSWGRPSHNLRPLKDRSPPAVRVRRPDATKAAITARHCRQQEREVLREPQVPTSGVFVAAEGSALADSKPQKGVGWGRSSEDDLLPHCARSETRRRTGSGSTAREREPTGTSMRAAAQTFNCP